MEAVGEIEAQPDDDDHDQDEVVRVTHNERLSGPNGQRLVSPQGSASRNLQYTGCSDKFASHRVGDEDWRAGLLGTSIEVATSRPTGCSTFSKF